MFFYLIFFYPSANEHNFYLFMPYNLCTAVCCCDGIGTLCLFN